MATKPPGISDPFSEAEENPLPVKQTLWERLNTGSGIPMVDEALKRDFMQKQAQANLYHKNASDLNGLLLHLNTPEGKSYANPQTGQPYTDDDIAQLQLQRDHAWGQYEKLVGIDKQSKGALQKAKSIIDFIHGSAGQRGGMAPPPTPDYPTNVVDAGVTTSGVTTPRQGPVASPSSFATNVGDTGVSYDASKAQQLTPPPLSPLQEATRASTQLPFATHPAKVGQAISDTIEERNRLHQAQVTQWTEEAKQIFGDLNSVAAKRYALTGTFGAASHLQLKPVEFTDANGKIQRVLANYDPIEGTTEYQGKLITNAQIADKPQLIKYMKPDAAGKPHLVGGFMVGTELFDQQMNPLPNNTEFYSRGLQGRDTLHQSITVGPDGKPIVTTLESISNPTFTKAIWGDEPSSATLPSNAPATTPTGIPTGGAGTAAPSIRKGGLSAAPKPQVSGGSEGAVRAAKTTDAAGRQLGIPTPLFKTQAQGATGVDQARNSLVGDNIEKGHVSGLAKDLDVFKDPAATARIGEYLQLVHNLTAVEGDSLAKSDDTIGAVKWFAGMPQAVIGLQQGALRDKYNELTTADKKFIADYFRVMGTMGGMRASTGMPGYQWAFTNMYNEMPTPGKVNDYDDAVRRLMNYVNETNVVTKRNPLVPKLDVNDVEKQIRGSSNKLTPAPKLSSPNNARPPLSSFEH